jgi:hypothetical protein
MDIINKLTKLNLGQFYTTQAHDIIKFDIPDHSKYIEPFAGQKHLTNFILHQHPQADVEMYDVSPGSSDIIKQDTLLHPPSYKNKYIITNPPYRARNKCVDKTIFDKYGHNDLYKCFIQQIINDPCLGFIIIIPSNFWISERDIKLRKQLCEVYHIEAIRVYEYPTFDDTDISVSVVKAKQGHNSITEIYLHKSIDEVSYNSINLISNNYSYRSNFIKRISTEYTITRWTSKNKNNPGRTNIKIKCISGSDPIRAEYVGDGLLYIDETTNLSARTYLTLVIQPVLHQDIQKHVVQRFNYIIESEDHGTYYREKNRRRITFTDVFGIISRILSE